MTPARAANLKQEKQRLRNILRHRRSVIPADLTNTTQFKVINHLRTIIGEITPAVVSLYTAREGELDLTPLVQDLWQANQTVALPRVMQRGHPLVFNIWSPNAPLENDIFGIPSATGAEIIPALIIVPMVGYTRDGYRLGSGGGYYDRTINSIKQPIITVGVSFTELEVDQFPVEPHDTTLNYIVTGKELITIGKLHVSDD